jgi:N-acetylmuramoyl-L-alanine amidase
MEGEKSGRHLTARTDSRSTGVKVRQRFNCIPVLLGVHLRSSAAVLLLTGTVSAASIAIDVGHYLKQPGAISARGVPEFEYNLKLARDIDVRLRQAGHRTLLIGDDGLSEDLARRAPRAASMDFFISVHHDSVQARYMSAWDYEGVTYWYAGDTFAGFSLFVSRANPQLAASLKCASAIGAALRQAGFVPSRYHADPVLGENRPFADELNGVHYFDNLAVLRTATIPALLFEAGVIVNRDEELRMRDPAVRQRIAESVEKGVGACLQPKIKNGGGPAKHEPRA